MLDELVAIALKAGAAIMPIYERQVPATVTTKSDGSPVTEADEAAEAVILAGLAALAPDIPVIAEEQVAAGRVPAIGRKFFLVDPLDGTKEFIGRNGEFTVNIALIEDGRPVLGVVYAPAIGLVFAGGEGEGARVAQVEDCKAGAWRGIAVSECPGGKLRVLASRSHLTEETKAFVARFDVADFVSAGSSLKFCKLAAGEADLYPRLGRTMEWDTAAGHAVLGFAGGRVVDLGGRDIVYGKSGFENPPFVALGANVPFPQG